MNTRTILAALTAVFSLLTPALRAQLAAQASPFASAENRTLQLNGDGSYVELPPNIFNDLSEITIEGWVKWDGFQHWSRFFDFGSQNLAFLVGQKDESPNLDFQIWPDPSGFLKLSVPDALKVGEWQHIAAEADQKGFRFYLNGTMVAESSWDAPLYFLGGAKVIGQYKPANPVKFIAGGEHNYLGRSNWRELGDVDLNGEMDEVRVWKVARTTEQIRENLLKRLTGGEPGLVGLWNFDDPANPGRDASPNHHDGKLMGNARAEVPSAAPEARVLTLRGGGNYLELPPLMFRGLNAATFECWVKWQSFNTNEHVFEFDAAKRVKVGNSPGTGDLKLQAAVPDVAADTQPAKGGPEKSPSLLSPEPDQTDPPAAEKDDAIGKPGALRLNEWHHLAVAFDGSGTLLYLDGALVGNAPYTGGLGAVSGADRHFVGACSLYPNNSFHGQFKEVRLWRSVRSAEQIRESLNKELTGTERGLVGLWNFADPAKPGRDASPNHHDGNLVVSARPEVTPVAAAPVQSAAPFAGIGNRVLELDGNGSYVDLPPGIIRGLEEVTVEGWVRWDEFRAWSRFFSFGQGEKRLNVMNSSTNGNVWAAMDSGRDAAGALDSPGVISPIALTTGQWAHVAVVEGKDGMSLYVNGVFAGKEQRALLSTVQADGENRLGVVGDGNVSELHGAMDEVRVWKVARTVEQIRENLLKQLTGSEPGLVALWNFDDPVNPGRDASPNHHDGKLMGNARASASASTPTIAAPAAQSPPPFAGASSRVLELDGNGSYVELPADAFNGLEQATIEGWVSWTAGGDWTRMFDFGAREARIWVGQSGKGETLEFNIDHDTQFEELHSKGSLVPGKWLHVACVSGPGGMKFYVDGVLAESNSFNGSFASHRIAGRNFLGRSTNKDDNYPGYMFGQMDEVRVWNVERTAEQVRENILKQLTGNEPGLAALWNFDDPANPGRDASPNHHDGKLMGNARVVRPDEFGKTSAGETVGVDPGRNGILDLDGNGSYVELPAGIFKDLEEATVEGWVLWRRYGFWSRFFDFEFGEPRPHINVTVQERGPKLAFEIWKSQQKVFAAGTEKSLELNRWTHLAAVLGKDGAKLYRDGELVASHPTPVSFEALENTGRYLLGGHAWKGPGNPVTETDGQMEEVRVWKVARTAEQIRENLLKQLTGSEPGLVGLWNFDDLANPVRDASPNHYDGKLIGNARAVPTSDGGNAPAAPSEKVFTVTISSMPTDGAGKPLPGAEVQLLQGARKITSAKSGSDGNCFLITTANEQPYRLTASFGKLEAVSAEMPLKPGPNKIDLQLRDTLRISGTLSDPDGQPRRGVKVEAVSAAGAVAAISVSNSGGKFVIRRLADGDYTLRAAAAGGPVLLENGRVFAITASQPVTDLVLHVSAAPQALVRNSDRANRVLSLNPGGGYVRLPPNIFNELDEATIEGWVMWNRLGEGHIFYDYGQQGRSLGIKCQTDNGTLEGYVFLSNSINNQATAVLKSNEWCHVAFVTGRGGSRLYLNGTQVAAGRIPASFSALENGEQHSLGKNSWRSGSLGDMEGQMDEVRVWVTARTGEEIRENMFRRLTGGEEGLAALWNFDDPDNPGRDATPNSFDGEMVKNAAAQRESLPAAAKEIAQWANLSGAAVDVDGRPLGKVKVSAERGDAHFDAETDLIGNFSILVRGSAEPWRVTATRGDLSATPASVVLDAGEHALTVTMRDAAPLSGHLRAPDGSPLPTVVVQALPVVEENVPAMTPGLVAEIFTIPRLTDFPVIPETATPIVQRIDPLVDFPLTNASISAGNPNVKTIFYARWKGRIRIGKAGTHAFHLAANDAARLLIDGRKVVESMKAAGQIGNPPLVVNEKTGAVALDAGDHELLLEFYNNDGRDGLQLAWTPEGGKKEVVPAGILFHERAKPVPLTVMSDARGRYRIPSAPPGRYTLRAHVPGGFALLENGREVTVVADQQQPNLDFTLPPFKQGQWRTYTHENGLAGDETFCVLQASDGALWFGTDQGASRFDGRAFSSLPAEDGMPRGTVRIIEEDVAGRIWMAGKTGLFRYDPKAQSPRIRAFTTADGLPGEIVTALTKDKTGRIWVGTSKGLCYYDSAADLSGRKAFASTFKAPADRVKDLTAGGRHGLLMGAARLVEAQRPAAFPQTQPMITGKVLELDGKDSYVELQPNVFEEFKDATVEAWVKWDRLATRGYNRVFDYGKPFGDIGIGSQDGNQLWFYCFEAEKNFHEIKRPGVLQIGKWVHVAGVTGKDGMKLYLDGALVGSDPSTASFAALKNGLFNRLGKTVTEKDTYDAPFQGQMDEVRIWNVARSADEIRENLSKQLTGSEPGLAALWNFEDGTARDVTPSGHDGVLMGQAKIVETQRPAPDAAPLVEKNVLQLDGATGYAEMPALALNGNTVTVTAWVRSDAVQRNSPHILSARRSAESSDKDVFGLNVDGSGTDLRYNWLDSKETWDWKSGLTPPVGRWFFVALVVTPAEATLYLDAGDGLKSAKHVMDHGVMAMAATLRIGDDKLGEKTGERYWNGAIDDVRIWKKALSPEEVLASENTAPTAGDPGLLAWWNFKETIPSERDEPLFAEPVRSLRPDSDGGLWIGTEKGVTLLPSGAGDPKAAHSFTSADGLASGRVTTIFEASDGTMWFGTNGGGVSRMNHRTKGAEASPKNDSSPAFTTFTMDDGLNDNTVNGIAQDAEGAMWFAGGAMSQLGIAGLSRYDGKSFVNFSRADGLVGEVVFHVHLDPQGGLWATTIFGVSHYDYRSVTILGEADGLDTGFVYKIVSTADGNVWFQIYQGESKLSRFDGRRLVKLTRDDGLPGASPADLYVDRDGSLLVSDFESGRPIARFDPASTTSERIRFELVEGSGPASALARSTTGELWMGRDAGALILGQPKESTREIGNVYSAEPGRDGVMWFETQVDKKDSIWRYEPPSAQTATGTWTEFTDKDGLPAERIGTLRGLLTLADGSLLAATMQGARRFDGKQFVPWPADLPRLQSVRIYNATRDAAGGLWLATAEGVFHTDGTVWSKLDMRDGLPEDTINRVHRATDGTVWMGGWTKGLARYRPSKDTPRSPVLTAQTDREYAAVAALPTINTGQRVTFKFDVVDFYTAIEKRQYRWQLFQGARAEKQLAANWQPPGTATQLEQTFAKPGAWTLAVQFIDRDLNYSKPTLATFNVALPWHENRAIIVPAAMAGVGLLGWALIARILYMRKRREAEKLRERLLEEEHAAREAAELARTEIEAKNQQLEESRAAAEESRAAAEEARQAADEASRTKSQFLANMSHELRTPMNAIIGYSEMLQEEAEDLDQKGFIPDLQKIHGAGKHLLGLINDILDLSKVEAGKMTLYVEEFEVANLVHEVAATVQPLIIRNNNTLVVACPADIGAMRADVTKLRQTLFNLLSNASKFTEKGTVTLEVGRGVISNQLSVISEEAASETPPLITDHGSPITFRVSDTGIGMTPEQMARIFEAFSQADVSTTRKYGGTGLGLAISRKFCQLMGGDITVASDPGVGTTFTVTLPRQVIEAAPEPASALTANGGRASANGQSRQATVLVIDDDANVRDLMQRTLVKDGFSVEVADNGLRGIELAKQLQPVVITLDVMMPGMDGWAVLTALKADPETAGIPVVMLTIVDDRNMGFALGAVDYFTKPIDWHRLSAALKRHRRSSASQTVLVVEDDAIAREMLRRSMEKDGWTVIEAENGRIGLERLNEGIPAIILLDLMMPEMDGFTFMEELRERVDCATVPVIVITAKDLTAEDHQRLNGGVSRIIQKGETGAEQLLAEVRALLTSQAAPLS